MEKNLIYETLKNFEKYSILSLSWDRRNGTIEKMVCFEGFDKNNQPLFNLGDNTLLDIKKIGGYSSIISIQEECPDGHCANC